MSLLRFSSFAVSSISSCFIYDHSKKKIVLLKHRTLHRLSLHHTKIQLPLSRKCENVAVRLILSFDAWMKSERNCSIRILISSASFQRNYGGPRCGGRCTHPRAPFSERSGKWKIDFNSFPLRSLPSEKLPSWQNNATGKRT